MCRAFVSLVERTTPDAGFDLDDVHCLNGFEKDRNGKCAGN